jgi:hypothetical protein
MRRGTRSPVCATTSAASRKWNPTLNLGGVGGRGLVRSEDSITSPAALSTSAGVHWIARFDPGNPDDSPLPRFQRRWPVFCVTAAAPGLDKRGIAGKAVAVQYESEYELPRMIHGRSFHCVPFGSQCTNS